MKYFVLKKPKEAPAVLRKPPRPTKQRDRPVSGPPTFRTAKLEEITGGPALHLRQLSREESPDLSVSNKENDRPAERKESNHERSGSIINGSADSGVDTDVSTKKILFSWYSGEKYWHRLAGCKFLLQFNFLLSTYELTSLKAWSSSLTDKNLILGC